MRQYIIKNIDPAVPKLVDKSLNGFTAPAPATDFIIFHDVKFTILFDEGYLTFKHHLVQ